MDLREGVDFDFAGYLSREQTESPAEVLSRTVLAYARSQGLPCKTVADANRRRSVIRDELSILPEEPAAMRSPTLPGAYEVGSDLGGGLRHGVQLRVQSSSGSTVIDWSSSMPALYGHTISLTYEPATETDAQVLADHGGIDGASPWLYRLRPVLSVDGEPMAQGPADDPGREARVEVILGHPSRYREARSAVHPVVVGGVYAFILDVGGDLRKAREASRARMASLPAGDLRTAEKLQDWGLDWFAERHRAYDVIAGVTWNRLLLDVNEAMASLRPRVTTVGGAVVSLARDRVVFDAGRVLVSPYAIDGDQGRSAFITKLAGHTGSFLEHRVAQGHWNRNQWSAVRVVQRARATGQVVMTIEPATENLLDIVSAPDDLKEDMRARLRSGHVITVPQLPVTDAVPGDLHAYIAVREETGEGAYVVEGAIDGDLGEAGEEEGAGSGGGSCEDSSQPTDSTVNLANGNYTFSETDLTLPARGIPIVFTRTYSSLDARSRSLGPGWSHSYERRLDEDRATGDVSYTDAEGRRRTWRSLGGDLYDPPPARFHTLSKDADGFSLESPDGRVERFALSGELLHEDNLNGNRVTLDYLGGRLVSVTDAAGRLVVSFTYTPEGRLETASDIAGREVRYAYLPSGDLAL
ncbi:MAG: RHS repeat protein [Deltaproteobacteria bacterium]|nr:RHS repeat protein [Deltaproteobacteria bacterium]